jgi:hypothetical protein
MGGVTTGTSAPGMDPVKFGDEEALAVDSTKGQVGGRDAGRGADAQQGARQPDRRQMEPKPVGDVEQLSASSARPSGPAMLPCRLANTPRYNADHAVVMR